MVAGSCTEERLTKKRPRFDSELRSSFILVETLSITVGKLEKVS